MDIPPRSGRESPGRRRHNRPVSRNFTVDPSPPADRSARRLRAAVRGLGWSVVVWLAASLPVQAQDRSALIARTRVSVVGVGTHDELASPRFGFRGTGFAVAAGRWIITNRHVLPDAPAAGQAPARLAIAIPQPDGETVQLRPVRVLRAAPEHDLALLEVEGPALPALALARTPVLEGQDLLIQGFPLGGALGLQVVSHRAMLSSITRVALPAPTSAQLDARTVARLRQGAFTVYQLDGVAYPGNSGGPVIDAGTGEVVAVVNMVWVKGTRESAISTPTGITYAIPVQRVIELLEAPPSP